jgi:hypothetical protein
VATHKIQTHSHSQVATKHFRNPKKTDFDLQKPWLSYFTITWMDPNRHSILFFSFTDKHQRPPMLRFIGTSLHLFAHLQLHGSQLQFDPHLQPPLSAPKLISDPS